MNGPKIYFTIPLFGGIDITQTTVSSFVVMVLLCVAAIVLGRDLQSVEDLKEHMEEVKIHLRGHNLYDIFYGRFKKNEEEILQEYIELAPREEFKDILDSIDNFIYFENRKKEHD